MNTLFNLALLIAVGVLWFDDHSIRDTLTDATQQIQELRAERNQLKQQVAYLMAVPVRVTVQTPPVPAPSPASTPSWFQRREDQAGTLLDTQSTTPQ
jgi:hypothetical protein